MQGSGGHKIFYKAYCGGSTFPSDVILVSTQPSCWIIMMVPTCNECSLALLDWWLVGPCPGSYFLPFTTLMVIIVVDQLLLETLLQLAPRILVLLLHWPLLWLLFPMSLSSFKHWNVPGSNLRLAPFYIYNHLFADLIHSPNCDNRLIEAWILPLMSSHTNPTTSIQHTIRSSGHRDQMRKRNERHPNWKGGSKIHCLQMTW